MNKIAIASDHAGYELKQNIVTFLQGLDVTTEDLGPHNSVSVDYPDYGVKVAKILMKKQLWN